MTMDILSSAFSLTERAYRARRIGLTFGRIYLGIKSQQLVARVFAPPNMDRRWSRFHRESADSIYDAATASLRELDAVVIASAHSSHVYRTGLNLYFTFVARHEDSADMEPTYLECWRRVMQATARHGGGVAHHHGAGRLRKAYIESDLGENGVALLRCLKNAIDPQGLMNPGNLIPDA